MNIEYTVDAFLDGESVEPAALDAALAAAEGRAYLIDALAIRQLLSDAPAVVVPAGTRRAPLFYVRAAVIALGLMGLGYAAGVGRTAADFGVPTSSAQQVSAPEPTRVIELKPGVTWHESKGGD
jgi:hypothetical protein